MLIIFSGLPGVGKSSIARELVKRLGAFYLRADTIEQAMREYGLEADSIGGMGYVVGYRVATENLRMGHLVVADTVNPWQLTRDAWRQAALDAGSTYLDVEVVCSDPVEHRRRVESRQPDIPGFKLPSWTEVIEREYHAWDVEPIRIDTAELSLDDAVKTLLIEMGHPA